MVQLYRQEYAEIILFYFALFSFSSMSLYFNASSVSLQLLGPDWSLELSVVGRSMMPALQYGDSACVQVGNSSTFSIIPNNTIVVFERPYTSSKVAHRVVDYVIRDDGHVYFRTKGDNNALADYWEDPRGEEYTWNGMISDKLVIGRVVAVRRGYAVWQPFFVMTTIVTSITILAFVAVLSLGGRKK